MSHVVTPNPLRARLANLFVRVGFPLIGVCLLTAGLWGVLSFAILPAVTVVRSQDWEPRPAVLESVILRHPASWLQPPLDTLEVRYRYTTRDGAEYVETCLDPQFGLYLRSTSDEALERLHESLQLTVWINPARPAEAVVRREFRWPVFLFAIPALAMALMGGAMLFAAMLSWNHLQPPLLPPGRRRGA